MEERDVSGTGGMLVGVTGWREKERISTMTCQARLLPHDLLPDHASKTSRLL